ncbi:MAG: acyl-CoA dehydrogenase family protein [Hyphomicrobiaceae bacterium]|nr:acyl-CoA dehydrogenase family protein [Hyphomicrobiaceae bacterium]
MNFDFSDDLKLLKDEARKFLEDKASPAAVRKVLEGPAPYDEALWREMAAMGWTGASIPEELGGAGLGHLGLCVLAEELGRSLAPVPFASTLYFAAEALMLAGSDAQKKAWLPRIAQGAAIGTLALAEGPGRSTPKRLRTTFRNGLLNGEKLPVPDGLVADMAIVAAQTDRGIGLVLADLAHAGVTREAVETLDESRKQARLAFANVPGELIGQPGDGERLLKSLEERAAILLAFEQVGGAQRCLEMACDYAMERYAFGRPIGSFQAIKHKLADVYVATELARSNAYYGAWALSKNASQLPLAAATARVSANEAFWLAAKENIQVHGGMGFTWAFDCHLYYRRAKVLATANGSTRLWKERLVSELESANAPG